MMVKLFPHQAEVWWDMLAPLIEQSLPPGTVASPMGMTNILFSILKGELIVWAYVTEGKDLAAVITTSVELDRHSGLKKLLIYTFTAVGTLERHMWNDALDTLRKHGRKAGCHLIVAYSNLPAVAGFFKRIGGRADYTLLEIDV